ncbi:MAG: DUF4097 family beta strand repeat protein [Streptosporangiales bacterium]|nr:DUF4097 family beta strand repeat protein [Streptosporangiales bacterium]
MARWTIEEPTELTFDQLDSVKTSLVGGHIAVLATEGTPKLEISALREPPLVVTHSGGHLTVGYEDPPWEGLLRWVRYGRRAATVTLAVPRTCRLNLGSVSAPTVVAGIEADTSVRTVSGDVTLDGLTERVDVQTVSGEVEARALGGVLGFNSVSGDVTVSSSPCSQLRARTISGKTAADLDLDAGATVSLSSVSGDIAVRLPEAAGLTIELRSTTGRVGTAFPGLTRQLRPGTATVRGTVGDGTGSLVASTVSGDIALLRREGSRTAPAEETV